MLKIFPKPEYVSPDLQHQQKYGTDYAVYKELANQLKDAIAIVMLVLVLIFRPQGILGEKLAEEKA